MTEPSPIVQPRMKRSRLRRFLAVAGPGIVVMLADSDAGGMITAAQSGAEWGYRLLPLQFLLVPLLYVVQELALRLGIVSGKGQARLIREHFGTFWAVIATAALLVASLGALLTEFSGLAGVSALSQVPVPLTMAIVVTGLSAMAYFGSYLTVERIAIAIGAFELVFLWVALEAKPDLAEMTRDALDMSAAEPRYLYLMAANIGAAIMPWMIFYQQSAVLDKRLGPEDLNVARIDTAVGAVITQGVMIAVLLATGATIHFANPNASLSNVQQIAYAIIPFLGDTVGRLVFAAGITGAALVATVVVCLAAAWGVGEVAGYKRSLEHHPREAPWFYGIFSASLIAGGLLVASGVNLVNLSIAVEVMNALLLPIVLGFLYLLGLKALPDPYRVKGLYAWVLGAVVAVTAGFGVYAGISGAIGGG
jgi:Mn2+/Fe2+ NRAMP family transporter